MVVGVGVPQQTTPWSQHLFSCLNTFCLNTCFVSQHLPLKADLCLNVKPGALPGIPSDRHYTPSAAAGRSGQRALRALVAVPAAAP